MNFTNTLSDPIMKEVFTKGILQYNLRICRVTPLPNPKSKKDGIYTVAYKTAQLWSTLPVAIIICYLWIYSNQKQETGIVVKASAISVKFLLVV